MVSVWGHTHASRAFDRLIVSARYHLIEPAHGVDSVARLLHSRVRVKLIGAQAADAAPIAPIMHVAVEVRVASAYARGVLRPPLNRVTDTRQVFRHDEAHD